MLGTQQTESLRQQLQRRRQELEAREKELAKLGKQIEQVAEDAQVKCRDHTPQEKLRQLIAALAAQQPLFERRRLLVQEGRQVAAEARKLIESLRQAYAKRATIITAAGVRSERALREAMVREEKHTALTASSRSSTGHCRVSWATNARWPRSSRSSTTKEPTICRSVACSFRSG